MNNSEVWRLYDYFRDDCLFIDIETAYRRGNISVIGLYNGYEVKSLIRNVNLEKQILKKYFDNCKLLVSFNGLSYDIPIIRKFFGNIIPNIPHLDLRHTLAKIGFCNGLKKIEKDLNIKRDESVKKLFGKDAAQLWKLFNFHEDDFFFEKLLKYNEEDVVNLKQLSEFVFKKLKTAYSNFLL